MKIKSFLAKPFASYIYRSIRKEISSALEDQENILKSLLKQAQKQFLAGNTTWKR